MGGGLLVTYLVVAISYICKDRSVCWPVHIWAKVVEQSFCYPGQQVSGLHQCPQSYLGQAKPLSLCCISWS